MTLETLTDVEVEMVEHHEQTQHLVLNVGDARVFVSHTKDQQTSIVVNGNDEKEQASIILDPEEAVDGLLHGPDTDARHSEYRMEHPRAGINSD